LAAAAAAAGVHLAAAIQQPVAPQLVVQVVPARLLVTQLPLKLQAVQPACICTTLQCDAGQYSWSTIQVVPARLLVTQLSLKLQADDPACICTAIATQHSSCMVLDLPALCSCSHQEQL
jgi:hypothetical protein